MKAAKKIFGRLVSNLYVWTWDIRFQQWDLRFLRFGDSKATVWPNGTWQTWDKNGVGGWNDKCKHHLDMPFEELHFAAIEEAWESAAKEEAWEACEKQGFVFSWRNNRDNENDYRG